MTCSIPTCSQQALYKGLCKLHYQRDYHGTKSPRLLRSDSLKNVQLDSVAVGWLVAVLEKLK